MVKKEKKRTGKKYSFDHLNKNEKPEKKIVASTASKEEKKSHKKEDADLAYFYQDLSKVGVIGLSFLGAILVLYYLVNYTEYLKPVLKLFKLA